MKDVKEELGTYCWRSFTPEIVIYLGINTGMCIYIYISLKMLKKHKSEAHREDQRESWKCSLNRTKKKKKKETRTKEQTERREDSMAKW